MDNPNHKPDSPRVETLRSQGRFLLASLLKNWISVLGALLVAAGVAYTDFTSETLRWLKYVGAFLLMILAGCYVWQGYMELSGKWARDRGE